MFDCWSTDGFELTKPVSIGISATTHMLSSEHVLLVMFGGSMVLRRDLRAMSPWCSYRSRSGQPVLPQRLLAWRGPGTALQVDL